MLYPCKSITLPEIQKLVYLEAIIEDGFRVWGHPVRLFEVFISRQSNNGSTKQRETQRGNQKFNQVT
jgi:hypothetical protein